MVERRGLTKAQHDFLVGMSVTPQTAFDGYRPAQRLVDLGFAERHVSRFGSVSFSITTAGRAALAERGGSES